MASARPVRAARCRRHVVYVAFNFGATRTTVECRCVPSVALPFGGRLTTRILVVRAEVCRTSFPYTCVRLRTAAKESTHGRRTFVYPPARRMDHLNKVEACLTGEIGGETT